MTHQWPLPEPSEAVREATASGLPSAPGRDAIIAKFTRWLDSVLEDELLPEGVAPELLSALEDTPLDEPPDACGEYEVWSTLASLAQEVKLQGRAFRNLTETVSPLQASLETLTERPAEDNTAPLREAIAALEASRADAERAASDAAWRDILELLLDIRDRLRRGCDGLQSTLTHVRDAFEARRLTRLLPGARQAVGEVFDTVGAVEQGNALLLERLDESLARMGVQEIPAVSLPFDAATMKAVDVETRDDMAEATVSAVLRSGYTWHGAVHRLAEVRVTRKRTESLNKESNS